MPMWTRKHYIAEAATNAEIWTNAFAEEGCIHAWAVCVYGDCVKFAADNPRFSVVQFVEASIPDSATPEQAESALNEMIKRVKHGSQANRFNF